MTTGWGSDGYQTTSEIVDLTVKGMVARNIVLNHSPTTGLALRLVVYAKTLMTYFRQNVLSTGNILVEILSHTIKPVFLLLFES